MIKEMMSKLGDFIKSPLNYVGGKYKLLPQIIPLFPDNINTFVDLFGGGFNVGINIDAERVIYNDSCTQLTELLAMIKNTNVDDLLRKIDTLIDKYQLSKTNKDGYLKLRSDYNNGKFGTEINPIVFYVLICYSFNNQFRFNKEGKFNMPFGANRSSFNDSLKNKFITFAERLHNMDCFIEDMDFSECLEMLLQSTKPEDMFVYADPPYLNSNAVYNEQGGWGELHEERLLTYLDLLTEKNVKWAMSNNLRYENPLLSKWLHENNERYNVHYLNADYSNCNYHKKDRKSKDVEILITNY